MYKIGITGVGGGVGQSIIKSLQSTDYELIGLDGDVLGAGLYAVPKSYIIPYARDERFIPTLLDICKNEKINVLFPGMDAELYKLSENREKFESIGTKVIVSNKKVIDIAENKWITYQKLTEYGFNVPATYKASEIGNNSPLGYPFILKPFIGGARSKDVYLIKNKEEWHDSLKKIGNRITEFIIQEFLPGDEYTCGTVTLENQCQGVILMRRELRNGDTYRCQSLININISEELKKLMNTIAPLGACNVQLKLKNNLPFIFEINARCSGTTASRALCGFNEPKMIADYLLKGITPQYNIQEKTILRYWNELEVDNSLVTTMNNEKTLIQNLNRQL